MLAERKEVSGPRAAGKSQLGRRQHALDPAQVDERAKILERNYHAGQNRAWHQLGAKFVGARPCIGFQQCAPRDHQVVATPIHFVACDAELQLAAHIRAGIFYVTHFQLRDGAKTAHARHQDLDTALVHAGHRAFHGQAQLRRLLQLSLGLRPACHRSATQDHATGLAHALHHPCFDLVADFHSQIAVLVAQLRKIDHALALAAG